MCEDVWRIVDVNWNRSREGLRVVEEFFRFIQNNKKAALVCKTLRHQITKWIFDQSFFDIKNLFQRRDVSGDCFKDEIISSESVRESSFSVVFANVQRVKESLRVLEEYGKLFSSEWAYFFQKLRFEWYDFEKKYCGDKIFLEAFFGERRK